MKTTPKHFALFTRACEKYRRLLGLTDWDFRYKHHDHPDGDALAFVHCNVDNRIASVGFARTWGQHDALNAAHVNRVAKHEVLHVLLADLNDMAGRQHGCHPSTREQAEHAVIRRLEEALP